MQHERTKLQKILIAVSGNVMVSWKFSIGAPWPTVDDDADGKSNLDSCTKMFHFTFSHRDFLSWRVAKSIQEQREKRYNAAKIVMYYVSW